jgi:hypothetical protein
MDKTAVGFVDTPLYNPKVPQQSVGDHLDRKDQLIREKLIADEYMKVMQERVATCFRTEGVNFAVNCKDIREKYWALCMDRYNGMLFPPDAQPRSRALPGLHSRPEL